MPDGSNPVLDLLSGLVFLLGIAFYAFRIIPPSPPREPPQTPVKWNDTGPIIGIDLGTRYSRVGLVVSDRHVKIFGRQEEGQAIPSVICLTRNETIVGFTDITKCFEGNTRSIRDLIHVVSDSHRPSRSVLPGQDIPDATLDSIEASALPIIAAHLSQLRLIAETFYGSQISQAVITFPQDFEDVDREVVKRAALLAGLSPTHFLDEAVAIGIAYGLDRLPSESHALVLDGGSSARAALLHFADGSIRVVSRIQNATLGSDAFNQALTAFIGDAYTRSFNDEMCSAQATGIEDQVEVAKRTLSFEDSTAIAVLEHGSPWLLVPLTVDKFDAVTASVVDNIVANILHSVLQAADVPARAVDYAILAGGSAYIPILQATLREQFPRCRILSFGERYPDEAVVYGAALFARRLALGAVPEERKIHTQDATPLRFGTEGVGGLFVTVIPPNSALPATYTRRFKNFGRFIKIFIGAAEYTNATEFVGCVVLPPYINSRRLQITFNLNTYGVLNVTTADDTGRCVHIPFLTVRIAMDLKASLLSTHSALLVPRRPTEVELTRMHADFERANKRADVTRRMRDMRSLLAQHKPLMQKQIRRFPADHPTRHGDLQILDAMDSLDVWLARHMLSASEEQFVGKLARLEELLWHDILKAKAANP
ncbi:Hsp70 protein-domain-containing protein [Mycena pura]|uniref:Hsp70 protein-domain-containing protein n=1 Tax=Mycena pura TaxID=153505 RepID=A0AAD6YBM5_9AGAR|nr:Hsp70 protein-domain-containing protein [Mycena pura]